MNVREVEDFKVLRRGNDCVNAGFFLIGNVVLVVRHHGQRIDVRLRVPGVPLESGVARNEEDDGCHHGNSFRVHREVLERDFLSQGKVVKEYQSRENDAGNQEYIYKMAEGISGRQGDYDGRHPVRRGKQSHPRQVPFVILEQAFVKGFDTVSHQLVA